MYIVTTSALFRLLVTLLIIHSLLSTTTPARRAYAESETHSYLALLVNAGTANPTPTPPSDSPAQIARDRINWYRALAGAPPVQLHDALITAAQRHADYANANQRDESAWTYGPHGEVAGKPGYTGKMPGDRAIAAGYPWAAGWEVMDFFGDPTRSVDALMATVFHRVGILDQTMQFVGYGHVRTFSSAVDVIDFGRGATVPPELPRIVMFPGANQTDVPLEATSETPDYLPPGASYPVGYPITQPISGSALTLGQAELRDSSGALVAVYPSPALCGTACYALIPVKPLAEATTYTVHIAGDVDGDPFEITWTFTTRTCPTPLDC